MAAQLRMSSSNDDGRGSVNSLPTNPMQKLTAHQGLQLAMLKDSSPIDVRSGELVDRLTFDIPLAMN